jgi:uridylate kinase
MKEQKHIVISVGGSMIIPQQHIDTQFLQEFVTMIHDYVAQGYTFTLFTGGGGVARSYTEAAESFRTMTMHEKDWLGISLTRANAQLLKTIFGDEQTYEKILHDPTVSFETDKPIVIGAGWKPGFSTDNDAVLYAQTHGISQVINISNIDFVYTKDPRKFPDAEKIEHTTWAAYRALIPQTWEAGLHSPFDPIASKTAQDAGIEVLIINGKALGEVRNAIEKKPFQGTHIVCE